MTTYSCKRLGNPDNPKVKWFIHYVDADTEADARKAMYNRGGDVNWLNPEKTAVWAGIIDTRFDP